MLSTSANYTFTNVVNRSLVAHFVAAPGITFLSQDGSLTLHWSTNFSGFTLQQNSDLNTANWATASEAINTVGAQYQAVILTTNGPRFFRLAR